MPFISPGKKPTIPQSRFQKPLEPVPAPKGPYEKRGGIPRRKFARFFKGGPFSMPWSRNVKFSQRGVIGEKILKERFPSYYGSDISGSEIHREVKKLRIAFRRAKTRAEQDAIRHTIVRLEEAKKRAGL